MFTSERLAKLHPNYIGFRNAAPPPGLSRSSNTFRDNMGHTLVQAVGRVNSDLADTKWDERVTKFAENDKKRAIKTRSSFNEAVPGSEFLGDLGMTTGIFVCSMDASTNDWKIGPASKTSR